MLNDTKPKPSKPINIDIPVKKKMKNAQQNKPNIIPKPKPKPSKKAYKTTKQDEYESYINEISTTIL